MESAEWSGLTVDANAVLAKLKEKCAERDLELSIKEAQIDSLISIIRRLEAQLAAVNGGPPQEEVKLSSVPKPTPDLTDQAPI